jgi:hypothetical protein
MDDVCSGMTLWFGVVEASLFRGFPNSPDGVIPPTIGVLCSSGLRASTGRHNWDGFHRVFPGRGTKAGRICDFIGLPQFHRHAVITGIWIWSKLDPPLGFLRNIEDRV